MSITIFSDGGGERGSAAAGACIVEDDAGRRANLVLFLGPGTNNEAEIAAGLLGFSFLRAASVTTDAVHWISDSEYVLKSATEYIHGWQRNGWQTAAKKPVKNQGLWQSYLVLARGYRITPEHVRGHTGHPENEACDSAATWAQLHGREELGGASHRWVSVGGSSESWLLVDGRGFIGALRSEGRFEPNVEASLELVRLLQLSGVDFPAFADSRAVRHGEFATKAAEAGVLEPLIEKLIEAHAAARALASQSEKAEALAGSLERLLKKYRSKR
ncbi:MAG: ribonuclease HI [Bdellovibrionales bacterium]|nr:ribonuclease HI [Bdellovibrionales bacterium]